MSDRFGDDADGTNFRQAKSSWNMLFHELFSYYLILLRMQSQVKTDLFAVAPYFGSRFSHNLSLNLLKRFME